jgi:nucleoside-diphosphate-sugar epimerase
VRELLARGQSVRALVRDEERARELLGRDPRLLLVVGDVTEASAFASALEGADVVHHAAAYFRESYRGGAHWDRLHTVNVLGTRELVRLAIAAGVQRFVHVSSVGVLEARAPNGAPVDETMSRDAATTQNDYYRSKILADDEVRAALAKHSRFDACFVLPGFMNGPGDSGPTSAGQTIIDFVERKLPGVVDANFSYVDARDVAFACAEAAERGRRGERYVVAGSRVHLREVYRVLEDVTGVMAPRREIPLALLAVVSTMHELWARLTGRPVLLGRATYRVLRDDGPYSSFDSSKAMRELDVRFRPLEDTLRDAVAWLEDAGKLPRARRLLARPA